MKAVGLVAFLLATALVVACDTIRTISVPTNLRRPLDRDCVTLVLRARPDVGEIDYAPGVIAAQVALPANVEGPRPGRWTVVKVLESSDERGSTTIELRTTWIGTRGSRAYREHMERVQKELREALEACARDTMRPRAVGDREES
jgi:hypothetical protein